MRLEEYFAIIRRTGLELTNANTNQVVQPDDVADALHADVSVFDVNIDRVDKNKQT